MMEKILDIFSPSLKRLDSVLNCNLVQPIVCLSMQEVI